MEDKVYNAHKKALVSRAMRLSVEALQDAITDEWNKPELPYLVFDAMTTALEHKLGLAEYAKWINSLSVNKGGV